MINIQLLQTKTVPALASGMHFGSFRPLLGIAEVWDQFSLAHYWSLEWA